MTPTDRLRDICKHTPGCILFSEADTSLDAVTLLTRATRLATVLRAGGAGPGSNVALLLSRGLDAVVAVYGILLAGACYVPLNNQFPGVRNRYVLQNAGCRTVIVNGAPPTWLEAVEIEVVDITSLPVLLPDDDRLPECNPNDNATILYTSGSTGEPKGVVISLRAITAFADWSAAAFSLDVDDRIASLAPFSFDLSLFDLFAAPAVGARTCFVPDELKLAPSRLVAWLGQHAISTWYTVPSMLIMLALKGGLDQQSLPQLRRVLFAGEVFPTPQLQRLSAQLPDTELFNLFGPTETNVCLYWPVDRSRLADDAISIPVGMPACGAELGIDPEQCELLVKGPCLMTGYWHAGNAKPVLDSEGWYHTGDRVSVNTAGEYEFHGRLDRMIKSSGYRVEPAEIEQVLRAAPGVTQAAVIGIPDTLSGTRIAAAVAVEGTDRVALQRHARQQLAAWMRPSFYLLMKDLPNLPNGKTDYRGITRAIEQELSV